MLLNLLIQLRPSLPHSHWELFPAPPPPPPVLSSGLWRRARQKLECFHREIIDFVSSRQVPTWSLGTPALHCFCGKMCSRCKQGKGPAHHCAQLGLQLPPHPAWAMVIRKSSIFRSVQHPANHALDMHRLLCCHSRSCVTFDNVCSYHVTSCCFKEVGWCCL